MNTSKIEIVYVKPHDNWDWYEEYVNLHMNSPFSYFHTFEYISNDVENDCNKTLDSE